MEGLGIFAIFAAAVYVVFAVVQSLAQIGLGAISTIASAKAERAAAEAKAKQIMESTDAHP